MKAVVATAVLLMAASPVWANSGRIPCELEVGAVARSLGDSAEGRAFQDQIEVAATLCRVDPERARTTLHAIRQSLDLSQAETQSATLRNSPEWPEFRQSDVD